MLGWEFPPYFAGGVGTVCYELTKGLRKKGVDITYVMPHGPEHVQSEHVNLLVADKELEHLGIQTHKVASTLTPYVSQDEYTRMLDAYGTALMGKGSTIYGTNLLQEMHRFAAAIQKVADHEVFDVIHAHDWTTVPAALALKQKTGKPLVMHVHITDFDKTGGEHADPAVYKIEHEGFHKADIVIAVSNLVKQRLVEKYYVDPAKIRVVHNAVEPTEHNLQVKQEQISPGEKLVLFLGRVTLQKGPDYFLDAAAKVARLLPHVKFIVAGTGDMLPRMIERASDLGIGNKVIFTGFVTRTEGDQLYQMADLFVMPSVSEPFGIVPLEAMQQGTPVIISRQSGVSEVLKHVLKVDFWNVDDLASKMIAALSYEHLHTMLQHHSTLEIQGFTWENPAQQCVDIYNEVLSW